MIGSFIVNYINKVKKNEINPVCLFIIFFAALIFGVFLWRERVSLSSFRSSFSVFGISLEKNILSYFFSFIEISLSSSLFLFLLFGLSSWISNRFSLDFKRILELLSLNCLWFFLLPINFYITDGYREPYPNQFVANTSNPYSHEARMLFPMDFVEVLIWFLAFLMISIILLSKCITSLRDQRVFKSIAVFLGGLSVSLTESFSTTDDSVVEHSLYFLKFFSIIFGVWFLYKVLSEAIMKIKSETKLPLDNLLAFFFFLLIFLPVLYRLSIHFELNIYFYVGLFVLIGWMTAHFIKEIKSENSNEALQSLVLYMGIPLLIFTVFFYPRLESGAIQQHTGHTYYIPYDTLTHGRLHLKDYPMHYRGFLLETGSVLLFKLFGISIYKVRLFMRFLEPFTLIIFYFVLIRVVPWYFAILMLLLIRTNYLWFNYTNVTGDWLTHIRYIYPDLFMFCLLLFFQRRKRIYLYFSMALLPLTLLNSPDLGYSIILGALCALSLYFVSERKNWFRQNGLFRVAERLYILLFIFTVSIFYALVWIIIYSAKARKIDYIFFFTFLLFALLTTVSYLKRNRHPILDRPYIVIIAGLSLTVIPFFFYLVRIESVKTFLLLAIKIPFVFSNVKAVAETFFINNVHYTPPIGGGEIDYFYLWHLTPLISYISLFLLLYLFVTKKKEFHFLAFLTAVNIIFYIRTMSIGSPEKLILSLHFSWYLVSILSFYFIRPLKTKPIFLYSLFLINFIPTFPLASNDIGFTMTQHHLNNFYRTTADAELKYLSKRNTSKKYLRDKFNGYFGNLQWFRDNEEELYRAIWAEEDMRIARKLYDIETEGEIDNTIWPRRDIEWCNYLHPFEKLKGKEVSLGWWIRADEPGRVRVFISDGKRDCVYSSYHSGNNNWEFLKTTKRIRGDADFLKVGLHIKRGRVVFRNIGPDQAHLADMVFIEGQNIEPPPINRPMSIRNYLHHRIFRSAFVTD